MSGSTQPRPARTARTLLAVLALLACGLPLHAQDGAVTRYREAQQALSQGEPFRAVELFTAALEANPNYAEALRGIAEAYYRLEEYDQAARFAERYLQNASDLADARNLLARINIGLGNLDRADELYGRVLAEQPNNLAATIGSAELAVARDNTETALARFEAARRLAPTNRNVLLSLALVHQYTGREDAAERYIMLALRHHPEHPLVHVLAAEYYLDRGILDRAATQADLALSLRPENEDARAIRARVAFLRSDYEAAAAAAEEVIGVNRDNRVAWYIRASALERTGRVDEAVETLQLALKRQGEDEFLRLFAEQILRRHREPDDELRGEYASYHFDRAERFRSESLLSRALTAYRRGLRLSPYDRRGRVGFAEVFRTQGYPAKYLQELEVLASVGEKDQFLTDRIESYRSALQETVAREWGVDQFSIERSPIVVDLFISPAESDLHYPDGAVVYGEYLRERMVSQERLAVPRRAESADGFAQAYASARTSGSDYFLLLGIEEDERSIRIDATLHLSRTGEELSRLRSYRTGNERIERAVGGVVEQLAATVPLRGQLLERDDERALISLGALDGIAPEDELVIVREGGVMFTTEEPGYRYAESEAVGTVTILRVDALVSEGRISRSGFYDLVSAGDQVVRAPPEDAAEPTLETPAFPALYRQLRRIR